MAEIDVEVGYSRGVPSERFGSKQALLKQLIARTEEEFQAQLMTAVGDKKSLAAVEARVGAHLKCAIRGSESVRTLQLLYMESQTVAPEVQSDVAEIERSYRNGFARHIREAQKARQVSKEIDTQTYAAVILAAVRGTISQWLIEPGEIDIPKMRAALTSIVLKTIRA